MNSQNKSVSARSNDAAVSAVVGAILMIAVTVVLGATVYAALNGFGDQAAPSTVNAAFKAQTLDADGDGRVDRIKVTYLTGPDGVNAADVLITVVDEAGGAATAAGAEPDPWDPGDFQIFSKAAAATAPVTYYVTVGFLGNTLVDQALTLDE